jgi:hypothetical protein
MANELNIALAAQGKTLQAGIFSPGWSTEIASIALTEINPGLYSGSIPVISPQLAYGKYGVVFFDTASSPRVVVGVGELLWDGSAEIILTRDELPFITYPEG